MNFDPSVGETIRDNQTVAGRLEIQPDGKLLVFSNFSTFTTLAGKSVQGIARLNEDGTIDPTFECNYFQVVNSAKVQPDGKIVVSGNTKSNGVAIRRLNSDGSLDPTFTNPYSTGVPPSTSLIIEGIQSDGKIVFLNRRVFLGSTSSNGLRRLNPDGSFDNSFSGLDFSMNASLPFEIQVLSDDKIFVAANHNKLGKFFRLMPNGSLDNSFSGPAVSLGGSSSNAYIRDFDFQSDGKIVVNGRFDGINGLSIVNFARLNVDGTVDTTFSNNYNFEAILEITSNDRIFVRSVGPSQDLVRLTASGTSDDSFQSLTSIGDILVDSTDRLVTFDTKQVDFVLVSPLIRFNTNGTQDQTFSEAQIGFNGEVTALGIQSDGKTLIAGSFGLVDGNVKRDFARVNADGSFDDTFLGLVPNQKIEVIAFQDDGKILIGGRFTNIAGFPSFGIARLNPTGTIDGSFIPNLNNSSGDIAVLAIEVQSDGKILVGGEFTTASGDTRNGFARLNPNGMNDTTFNPMLSSPSIRSIIVQDDGKIMLGGSFNGINGTNRSNLARLNSDGTLDSGFNAGNIGIVDQIFRQPNGDYFLNVQTTVTLRNPNGSVDNSFTPPTVSGLREILPQDDGTVILAGSFNSVNNTSRNRITRLLADGSVDLTFYPSGLISGGVIEQIKQQNDGKVVIGGTFSDIEDINRSSIARLSIDPVIPTAPTTNFDFDGDGKADIAVFRPTENKWYVLRSSDFGVTEQVFGANGDSPLPADFDGDGKLDYSIFRNSLGDWWSLSTVSGNQVFAHLGQNGDIPRPSDFDGDGKTDYVVYRPETSQWFRFGSSSGSSTVQFGIAGDKPIVGDFDGDGKSDVAIYRPSTGDWWWQNSSDGGQRAAHWGISTDIPTPGDYDGDGQTDLAVYRPETGTWYIYNSTTQDATIIGFGLSEDKPVPADYDGDGKTDIAVYRPSTGVWYLLRSTDGFAALQFGISSDIPIPNALIP